ncbi:MAG: sirohydrochlorin cobaltochelatase [Firmicutes bacterium]|nr:sirohydrochlorin cobaltochelatase [Bacillota bacterium]
MKKKIILALLLVLTMTVTMLAGCGGSQQQPAEEEKEEEPAEETEEEEAPAEEAEEVEEEDEENYETGDASLDDPRNADEIGETELLVASFGTSFNDSRRLTIGGIEGALEKAFPELSVRRGFTSQIIIDHVKKRDNVAIDNIEEALDRAEANGVKTLVVQPTHLMNGFEYNDLVNEIGDRADAFEKVVIGEPLLTSDEDFERVAKILYEATKEYDDGETAICFMGHGTEAESNGVYAKMQEVMTGLGYENYYVGTVEAEPSLEDLLKAIGEKGTYKKVVLEPMMVVAGDHANNDMAGDEEDSWKSQFEAAGYEVTCLLRGLGELPEIQQIYVEHCQKAVDSLS